MPHFDPAETGVRSRALLLLEGPGPKTVPEWGGSGFISVNDSDPTAQNGWNAHLDLAIGDRYRVLRTKHPAGQSFAQPGAREHFTATLAKVVELIR